MAPKRSRASAPSKGAAKKRKKAPMARAAPKPTAPTGAYITTRKTPTGQVRHDVAEPLPGSDAEGCACTAAFCAPCDDEDA